MVSVTLRILQLHVRRLTACLGAARFSPVLLEWKSTRYAMHAGTSLHDMQNNANGRNGMTDAAALQQRRPHTVTRTAGLITAVPLKPHDVIRGTTLQIGPLPWGICDAGN